MGVVVMLGEQTIAVPTQTPSPEPGLIARILGKSRYMPPLLGFDEATDRSLGA